MSAEEPEATIEEEKPEVKEESEKEEEEEEEEVEYVCPPEFDEREEMRKMFVGGLDKETTDDEFKALFSTFGEVTDFIIIRKDQSKSDRLFGFITFGKCDELEDCLLARPHKYKEKELDVKRAVPKGQDDGTGHFKVKKLHVGNVPTTYDPKILKKYLKSRHPKKYGTIEEINFLKAKDESGKEIEKNRGFGFITVSSEDFADRLAIAESKFTLDGNNLRISKAKPKPGEAGATRGGFRGKGQGYSGGHGGGWDDWSGYGYGGGFGYGYGGGYGYGSGYDYYGYPGGYQGYGAVRSGRGGGRYNPY